MLQRRKPQRTLALSRQSRPTQFPPQRSGSSSRETLSAVPHGGNPQDQTADAPTSLPLR
ncbi:hypothetical protein [Calothrix sp. NIES-2098]|uniref:hypothetical protein n=1 Tax=Calothrix sp. NIES-2098 TaxID=1954171 RepID=UPI0030D6CF05